MIRKMCTNQIGEPDSGSIQLEQRTVPEDRVPTASKNKRRALQALRDQREPLELQRIQTGRNFKT